MTDTDVYIEAVSNCRDRERSRRTMPVYRYFSKYFAAMKVLFGQAYGQLEDAFSRHLNTDSSIEAQNETRQKEQTFAYVHFV
jgi:methionine salvage enolase-phosphatase E1